MGKFTEIPIKTELFKNLDEAALTSSYAALEGAFINEAGGITRFPGLTTFADFGNASPVYLGKMNNDMIAVTGDGKVRRIDKKANVKALPGPPVLGRRRVTFGQGTSSLYLAAGSRIIDCDGEKLEVLSDDAPNATHVAVLNNYVLANEVETQFFHNSGAGAPRSWDGLDIFAADTKPDNVTCMIVTDFGELIVGGPDSIEQYERLTGGDAPFARRWSIGDGISEPDTLIYEDNAFWALNKAYEFSRYSGQSGQVVSSEIEKDILSKYDLSHVDSFDNAWAAGLHVKGQTFIVLQFPSATNDYGSLGITYALDVRQSKIFQLYGWDDVQKIPAVWPGVSILNMWGRTYVGGHGRVYELPANGYSIDNKVCRFYARTAHYANLGLIRVDSIRVTLKRGVGSYTASPKFGMRVNRDDNGFGQWQWLEMGKSGDKDFVLYFADQGDGDTWQFEFLVTDDCPLEIRKIEAEVTPLVR